MHKVSESEFNAKHLTQEKPLTRGHDWYLTDTANAGKALFSYVAYADQPTQDELEFASQDLAGAKNLYDASHPHSQAVISAQRYQHYSQLAEELLNLVEQVAELSQFSCDSANQLAGDHVDASKRLDENKRVQCENKNQTSR